MTECPKTRSKSPSKKSEDGKEPSYRDIVINRIETRDSEILSNSEPQHAAVLYEVMFDYARERVHIFCENLNPVVFGRKSVLTAFSNAVERGVKCIVLTERAPSPDNPFYKALTKAAADHPEQIETKALNGKDFKFNLSYADDRMYRFELEREKIEAVASMNDPETVNILDSLFNGLHLLPVPR